MTYTNKWCDLPPELLDEVANRLDVPSDTWHLRSVCSTWRSTLSSCLLPDPLFLIDDIIMFQPTNSNHNDYDDDGGGGDLSNDLHHRGCHLRLAKHTFFHLSLPQSRLGLESAALASSSGWLMKSEEHKPGGFRLLSPFSRTSAKRLLTKHLSSPTNIHFQMPFKLDLTNVKFRELGYEYVLQTIHNGDNHDNINGQDLHNMEHQKVALIKLPVFHDSHPHHRCVDHVNNCADAYAILSTHDTGKLLLYWSPLKEWSFLDHFPELGYDDRSIFVNDWSLHYVDVVEYNGSFYAVTNSGRTVAIKVSVDVEVDDSSFVTINLLAKSVIGGDKKCLVKSADDLLMVDLYTCPTPGTESLKVHAVDIFKLDTQEGTWVLVKTLGDRALFLSNHSSFSASTSTLSGCKPNTIYFHFKNYDKEFCYSSRKKGDCDNIDDPKSIWTTNNDIGIFDFEKGIHGSLEDYLDDSTLFSWPPPAWITWTT